MAPERNTRPAEPQSTRSLVVNSNFMRAAPGDRRSRYDVTLRIRGMPNAYRLRDATLLRRADYSLRRAGAGRLESAWNEASRPPTAARADAPPSRAATPPQSTLHLASNTSTTTGQA